MSDRFDRRRVMLAADVTRGLAVAAHRASCRITGALELWHMVALVAVFGAATSLLRPGVRRDRARRAAGRRCSRRRTRSTSSSGRSRCGSPGPAIGGLLIDGVGVGWAFALNAATFAVSAAALLAMAPIARTVARRGRLDGRRHPGGLRLRPPPRVAVGDVRERRDRLPAVHGPGRGAAAVRRQERPPRAAPPTSGSSSRPAASARSRAPWSWASAASRGATSPSCTWRGRPRRWRSPATASPPPSGS